MTAASTDPERLAGLADRCEAASGPDRALMMEAFAACHPEPAPGCEPGWRPELPRQPIYHAWKTREVAFSQFVAAEAWLDAAMTLVPEGWKLRQANFSAPCADDRKWHLNLHGGREGEDTFVGRGATSALALCAAALRARAHQETRP